MDSNITAIEIGQRCRKFRQVLGLSQQALADRIGTTPQNISKYEKEGIYNIDVIQALSAALEQDLLTDEKDQEGAIGEVGGEILLILLEERGTVAYADLLVHRKLFGLPEERVIRELFKLQQIGLVVREEYTDIYEGEQDIVFITAKGIISYKHKNIESFARVVSKDEYIDSYEVLCEGFASMQDCCDHKEHIVVDELLGKLDFKSGFRVNFIYYIMNKKNLRIKNEYIIEHADRIKGHDIFYDIMHSMICHTTRNTADVIVERYRDTNHTLPIMGGDFDRLAEQIIGDDTVLEDFLFDSDASDYVMIRRNVEYARNKAFLRHPESKEKIIKYIEQESRYYQFEELDDARCLYNNFFENRKKLFDEIVDVESLFSKEEIIKFVEDNILPAVTDEEKELEKLLKEIIIKYPDVLEYFKFPSIWEENGVADYIREKYYIDGVDALKPKGDKSEEKNKLNEYHVTIRKYTTLNNVSHRQIVDNASGAIIYDADECDDPEFVAEYVGKDCLKLSKIAGNRCPNMKLIFDVVNVFGYDILANIPTEELEKYIVDKEEE